MRKRYCEGVNFKIGFLANPLQRGIILWRQMINVKMISHTGMLPEKGCAQAAAPPAHTLFLGKSVSLPSSKKLEL